MIYDKKGTVADNAKNKLAVIQSCFEKIKIGEEWYNNELKLREKLHRHCSCSEPPKESNITHDEIKAYQKYQKGKYFNTKEKDLIIDYLIDCLVNDGTFEYSTLGPNIYKNEHSISNVSDTQL